MRRALLWLVLLVIGVGGALYLPIVYGTCGLDQLKIAVGREDHARIDRNAVPTNADARLMNV